MIACFLFPQAGIAVERARTPRLWGEPCALAGADGILQVVSDEAEANGVCAGQTVASARALCPGLLILPYDRPAYEAAMRPIWDALAVESSVVEPAGPEMAYVELTGLNQFSRIQNLADALAARIRITVQAGLARTKLVSCQAALRASDGQVSVVPAGSEPGFLASVPFMHVSRVEPKLCAALERLGVCTLGDLAALPEREVRRRFRARGDILLRLARGEDSERVRALWPPRRVRHEVSFDYEVCQVVEVERALRHCAARIAARLVGEQEFARSLIVRVRLPDGSYLQQEERLRVPSADAAGIFDAAFRLLRRLRIRQPLTAVEVIAVDLGVGSGIQVALFDACEAGVGYPHERRQRLEETLGYIRGRFGVAAVVPLRLLYQARRIHLWADSIGHLFCEPIEVATTRRGTPVRYWRRGEPYEVVEVHDRWREASQVWHELVERTTYRVETDPPPGFWEVQRVGRRWLLVGTAD